MLTAYYCKTLYSIMRRTDPLRNPFILSFIHCINKYVREVNTVINKNKIFTYISVNDKAANSV